MQCKDIPDIPILEFLSGPFNGWAAPGWGTWFWTDDHKPPNSVVRAMPSGATQKLALEKIKSLIKRKLVTGCGCRGDFELTDLGWLALNTSRANTTQTII